MNRIFVYGSLMKGFGNHRLLEKSRFICDAKTRPEFKMFSISGAYPGVSAEGSTAIHGELYEVDEETLARLDQLEGHPHFYRRTTIALDCVKGTIEGVRADAYLLPPAAAIDRMRITSGSWREWSEKQRALALEEAGEDEERDEWP